MYFLKKIRFFINTLEMFHNSCKKSIIKLVDDLLHQVGMLRRTDLFLAVTVKVKKIFFSPC